MRDIPEPVKNARQAKWREKNPKAVWAQASLRSALRRGLVEAKPCEVCGSDPADAHHPDYDRPMLVKWLCRLHHCAEHRKQDESRRAA